jgi:cytochrome c-type biogenesis protein CcmE
MKPKTIIGTLLLIAFTFMVVKSFSDQVSGYETFALALERGERAHVVGEWVPIQPTAYDVETNEFSFYMADEDGAVRQVLFRNPKPANFEDADKVVVDGRFQGDVFVADNILVKCPSKYNDERGLNEMPVTPASIAPSSSQY